MLLLAGAACERREPSPAPAPVSAAANTQAAGPQAAGPQAERPQAAQPAAPAVPVATRATALRALAQLEDALRAAAGDPQNPWALAHGLLAFGKDYQTRDGRSAAEVAASFAERRVGDDGRTVRYGFAVERNGKPVEPHPYLIVKTLLEVGIDPALRFEAADGATLEVARLIDDMRASVREPETDAQWHDAAWWLTALELAPGPKAAVELPRLRAAALARLEADDAVLAAEATEPFAPSAPMGAAKRNKTHIYGHPCGGLHFVQAVLRGAAASTAKDAPARARRQLQLLVRRHDAERTLYAQTLRARPDARLLVAGQQLKFYGHLLETLALADELGLSRDDAVLRDALDAARRKTAGDLLATLAELERERAYARLDELAVERPQLQLDLIGDGCHAIHGLRQTLAVLPP